MEAPANWRENVVKFMIQVLPYAQAADEGCMKRMEDQDAMLELGKTKESMVAFESMAIGRLFPDRDAAEAYAHPWSQTLPPDAIKVLGNAEVNDQLILAVDKFSEFNKNLDLINGRITLYLNDLSKERVDQLNELITTLHDIILAGFCMSITMYHMHHDEELLAMVEKQFPLREICQLTQLSVFMHQVKGQADALIGRAQRTLMQQHVMEAAQGRDSTPAPQASATPKPRTLQ